MEVNKIKKIILEEDTETFSMSKKIFEILPHVSIERGYNEERQGQFPSDMGKDLLHLIRYKGDFLKPCPGTKDYICCGYQILNIGTNCPLDCSYCILQSYFNRPHLRVFVNLEEELQKLIEIMEGDPHKIHRIGTGEFTDSLALDPIAGWTNILLPVFSGSSNAVLELKTKTCNINNLVNSKYRDRIIVSWSLSSPFISAREEKGAPVIKERIKAAQRCQSEGFIIGFHFDPLIFHEKWKDEYKRTLDLLNDNIDPKGIIWISMGSFRFIPDLKTIIRKRHKKSLVLKGEFIPGLDGKMRYFKQIRIELYSFMKENLEKWHEDLGLYLCMESDDIWEKALGFSPRSSKGLSDYLDNRVLRFFN
jgi:spore photoproduct lyase